MLTIAVDWALVILEDLTLKDEPLFAAAHAILLRDGFLHIGDFCRWRHIQRYPITSSSRLYVDSNGARHSKRPRPTVGPGNG
jgi:hypothetical protein